jgi:hypothetical protein
MTARSAAARVAKGADDLGFKGGGGNETVDKDEHCGYIDVVWQWA